MSTTERMAAIHIDPAATNNRADGSSAGNAWRDAEELLRRLGRGTAWFRQPTTITLHGALSTSDPLNLHAAVGRAGLLSIDGDRGTAALTGTFSAKTDFVAGSQAQQVTGTGLSSHLGKQVVITASATPSHVNAIARIAKSVSGDNVRTTPFAVPKTDGTRQTGGVAAAILPSVGDTFAVYTLPTAPVGTISIEPASNRSSINGSGLGYARFQNLSLVGDTGTAYSGSIRLDLSIPHFIGCDLKFIAMVSGTAAGGVFQACLNDGVYYTNGTSIQYFTLVRESRLFQTQCFNSHYMDCQHILAQGVVGGSSIVLPIAYGGGSLVLNYAEAYDSPAIALEVRRLSKVWVETALWGSGNTTFGVSIQGGATLEKALAATTTLTGSSGDITCSGSDGGTAITHSWTEGFFKDAFGTGIVRRG